MQKMNKAQAVALFEEHAILFGDTDAVPTTTAAALLGQTAVDYVLWEDRPGDGRRNKGYWNGIGMNDYIKPLIHYLTLAGFLRAVTYNNAKLTEADLAAGVTKGKGAE